MNSCEFLSAVLVEGVPHLEPSGFQLRFQPSWGEPEGTEGLDGGHFGMVGGDHANLPFASVALDDSFNQAVGRLARGGIQDGQRVARFFLFPACLTVEDEGDKPAAGVMQFRQVADQLLACGGGLFRVKGPKVGPGKDDTVAVDQEVAGRGIRPEPRGGAHPAAGLAVLLPAFVLSFLRFR